MSTSTSEHFLTPAQVASRFGVDAKTVTRWAKAGKLAHVITPGGHRRYPASEIDRTAALHGHAEP